MTFHTCHALLVATPVISLPPAMGLAETAVAVVMLCPVDSVETDKYPHSDWIGEKFVWCPEQKGRRPFVWIAGENEKTRMLPMVETETETETATIQTNAQQPFGGNLALLGAANPMVFLFDE
mmetsp:Transcript_17102/g.47016  ORF Transcript_17102/g.47016 Transcript_17102/m.47016 type:complete len:122 (-) Transcript_17102:106-471(-)